MVKNKDWNEAFAGNEDWKAAMSSEIFRSFVSRTLVEEQEELRKKASEVKKIETAEDVFELLKNANPVDVVQDLNDLPEYIEYTNDEYYGDVSAAEFEEAEKVAMEEFEKMVKEANLREDEEALGLLENAFYMELKRGKND